MSEEDDFCRVCRMPASPSRPLRYPCKCSGSIRYIHQDCLLMWLSHSKSKSCELCGHKFMWTPIYAENAPLVLPFHEVLLGVLTRARAGLNNIFRFLLVLTCWMILVPFHTSYIFYLFFSRDNNSSTPYIFPYFSFSKYRLSSLAADCILGSFLTAATLFLTMALISLVDYLNSLAQLGIALGDENENNAQQQPVAAGLGGNENNNIHNNVNNHDHENVENVENVEIEDEDTEGDDSDDEGNETDDEDEEDEEEEEDAVEENEEHQPQAAPVPHVQEQPLPAPINNEAGPFAGLLNLFGANGNLEPEEDIDFEELVGLRGPLSIGRLLIRASSLICYNGVFMLIFAFVPITLGHSSIIFAEKWMGISLDPFIEGQERKASNNNLFGLLVGYCIIGVMIMLWLMVSYIISHGIRSSRNPLHRAIMRILSFTYTFSKVTTVMCAELGFFPIIIGWWLDVCTVKVFGATLDGRVAFFHRSPLISTLAHWIIGLGYMFHIASFVQWVRDIVRPGVLWFLRDPTDPTFNPLKEMVELSIFRHARRLFLSLAIYSIVVILLIWLPIQVVHRYVYWILPFHLWTGNPMLQGPIDIIFVNIVVPYTLEHCRPKSNFKLLLKFWITTTGKVLSITSYLLPAPNSEQQQQQQAPNQNQAIIPTSPNDITPSSHPGSFVFRIVVLLNFAWVSMALFNILAIAIPTVVGRMLFFAFSVPQTSDLYTLCVGFYFLYFSVKFLRLIYEYIKSNALPQIVRNMMHWGIIATKCLVIASFWVGLIPVLIGVLFELLVVVPFRVPVDQTPDFFLWRDWAVGLLYLKIWYRVVLLRANVQNAGRANENDHQNNQLNIVGVNENENQVENVDPEENLTWKAKFDQVAADGFGNINFIRIFRQIIFPIISTLSLFLSIPYIIARGVIPSLGGSVVLSEFVFRFGYFGLVAILLFYQVFMWVQSWIKSLHNSIRDDKYLTGLQLHNLDHLGENLGNNKNSLTDYSLHRPPNPNNENENEDEEVEVVL